MNETNPSNTQAVVERKLLAAFATYLNSPMPVYHSLVVEAMKAYEATCTHNGVVVQNATFMMKVEKEQTVINTVYENYFDHVS